MSRRLRFRARGVALVQNLEKMEANIKSFIGRKFIQVSEDQWGFDPTNADEEVPFRGEYVKACRDGDLWPADAATAALCGVPFDPNFGAPAKAKSEKG